MKKTYYKDFIQVKEVTGWGKMYYCFRDLDYFDSAYLLNYLIDSEPVPEATCLDRGYEDYLLYTVSFIQERLGTVSRCQVNRMMDDLVKHEYIIVHQRTKKSPKYIKLNYKKIAKAMGIEELNDNTRSGSNYY